MPTFYQRPRRRRLSYQEYLAGGADEVIAAEVAASSDSSGGSSAWRSIGIGVATGVLTLLVNRWLGQLLK